MILLNAYFQLSTLLLASILEIFRGEELKQDCNVTER